MNEVKIFCQQVKFDLKKIVLEKGSFKILHLESVSKSCTFFTHVKLLFQHQRYFTNNSIIYSLLITSCLIYLQSFFTITYTFVPSSLVVHLLTFDWAGATSDELQGDFGQAVVYWKKVLFKQEVYINLTPTYLGTFLNFLLTQQHWWTKSLVL